MINKIPALVFSIFFFNFFLTFGQYYDGGVSLTGAYEEKYGYNAHLSYSHRILNHFDFIDVGVQVNASDLTFEGFKVPTSLYALNAGFYYDLIRNNRRFFYKPCLALTIGGGFQVGYESFDFSEIPLADDARLNVETEKLVYGPYVGANVDLYFNSIFALAFKVTETYHVNSDIGKFIPYVGLGLKFVWFY